MFQLFIVKSQKTKILKWVFFFSVYDVSFESNRTDIIDYHDSLTPSVPSLWKASVQYEKRG